uniref:Uncharacterized protein n=1 Tax=Glossina brevipalpis TaxID=37001 RepID=A0A1A9WW93_9MUSC
MHKKILENFLLITTFAGIMRASVQTTHLWDALQKYGIYGHTGYYIKRGCLTVNSSITMNTMGLVCAAAITASAATSYLNFFHFKEKDEKIPDCHKHFHKFVQLTKGHFNRRSNAISIIRIKNTPCVNYGIFLTSQQLIGIISFIHTLL